MSCTHVYVCIYKVVAFHAFIRVRIPNTEKKKKNEQDYGYDSTATRNFTTHVTTNWKYWIIRPTESYWKSNTPINGDLIETFEKPLNLVEIGANQIPGDMEMRSSERKRDALVTYPFRRDTINLTVIITTVAYLYYNVYVNVAN